MSSPSDFTRKCQADGLKFQRWMEGLPNPADGQICNTPRCNLTYDEVGYNPLYIRRYSALEEIFNIDIENIFNNELGELERGELHHIKGSTMFSEWFGLVGPNYQVLESVARMGRGPYISEISYAFYTRWYPISSLRFIYFPNIVNQMTRAYIYSAIDRTYQQEQTVWEYNTARYQGMLGTNLGKIAAQYVLGAYPPGSHIFRRIKIFHSFGQTTAMFEIDRTDRVVGRPASVLRPAKSSASSRNYGQLQADGMKFQCWMEGRPNPPTGQTCVTRPCTLTYDESGFKLIYTDSNNNLENLKDDFDLTHTFNNELDELQDGVIYIQRGGTVATEWHGVIGPNYQALTSIERLQSNADAPHISDLSYAIYTNFYPISNLRFIYIANVKNANTKDFLEQVLRDCTGNTETWDYNTPEYQAMLGTDLGKVAAHYVLGAFQPGSRIFRQIKFYHGAYNQMTVRFEIEKTDIVIGRAGRRPATESSPGPQTKSKRRKIAEQESAPAPAPAPIQYSDPVSSRTRKAKKEKQQALERNQRES